MKQRRYDDHVREMSDQQLKDRYYKETLKLKTLLRFGRQSERFLGYPNTLMMNLGRRELKRRGLPIPDVRLPEEEV